MTKEQVIAWSDQADEHADKTLQCKGEFHPDWHEVRDAYFANLVRNAALEEAAQKCVNYPEWAHWGQTDNYVIANKGAQDCASAIESLKEPTP